MFSRKIKYILAGVFCIFFQNALAVTRSLNDIQAPSPEDKPTPAEVKQITAAIKAGDYSSSYYYGPAWNHEIPAWAGKKVKKYPVDYVKARKYAFVEMTRPDLNITTHPDETKNYDLPVTYGAETLVMIYANGLGVPKNLNYARHIAAMGDDDEFLMLENALNKPLSDPYAGAVDLTCCNVDIPASMYGIACVDISYRKENELRLAETDALSANWTPEQKAALQSLIQSADKFFHQSTIEDPTLSVCGKDGNDKESQEHLMVANKRDQLTHELKQFAAGKFPVYTAADFRESDETLNRNYQHALRVLKRKKIKEAKYYADPNNDIDTACDGPSLPDVSEIQDLEKNWIHYRDAWVRLGALRYPAVPPEVWKTWMTRQRNKQIATFINDIDGMY